MAASEFHFYQKAFSELNSALVGYIDGTASNVVGAIAPTAYTLLMIYTTLWGWAMLRGLISEPITDGLARIIRLSIITGIAINIGRYSSYVSGWLWNTPDALASVVIGGYSGGSTVDFLDTLMSKMYDLGDAYWQKANAANGMIPIPDLGMTAIAIIIWLVGVAATAYGAFLLALSKMALAIILGVGPIFVLLLIFDGTKRFFEAWAGQALNYVFLVMLTAAGINLILTILDHYLNVVTTAGVLADPHINQALPAIVFGVIGALVLVQLPSIASALGGGVAVSTLGAAGWAYGKAKGGVTAMRPTNLRRSYNKAASDVRIVRGAAAGVAGAPMAVYRRITGGAKNRVSNAR